MGRRIGGGAAHSFYVGLETKRGEEPKALCLIPRGHEEGQTVELGSRTFNLTLGRPVQFPLFTSTSDRVASSGEIVTVDGRPSSAAADSHGAEERGGQNRTGSRASARNSDGDRNTRTVVRVRRIERAMAARVRTARRNSGRKRHGDRVDAAAVRRSAQAHRADLRRQGGCRRRVAGPSQGQADLAQLSSRHWDRASSGACRCCANCGARCTPARASVVDRPITSGSGFSSPDTRCVPVSAIRWMTGAASRRPHCSLQAWHFTRRSRSGWSSGSCGAALRAA